MFGINYDPAIDMLPLAAAPGISGAGRDTYTSSPLTPPPAWIGPPVEGGACAFTGLARATFQTKLLGSFGGNLVRVSLRQQGAERGKQLVFTPSLHELLLWTSSHPGEMPDSPPDFHAAKIAPIPRRWVRAPKNGSHCEFCSLGHYSFYALLEEAGREIQVSELRLPSESRASRLVWLPSLHSFLVTKAEQQFRHSSHLGQRRT